VGLTPRKVIGGLVGRYPVRAVLNTLRPAPGRSLGYANSAAEVEGQTFGAGVPSVRPRDCSLAHLPTPR
jgi:hypothetical protein